MTLSINQVFENHAEKTKEDRNWDAITKTLAASVTDIQNIISERQARRHKCCCGLCGWRGESVLSEEQEVYIYLVVLEDFDAYYDGRYGSIIDTWAADVWKTKSTHWREVFTKAWMEQSDGGESEPQYFRPSKCMLNAAWMEKNGMKDIEIETIKSITFRD